jgi:flagellar basal-body rod modification protein FlgD
MKHLIWFTTLLLIATPLSAEAVCPKGNPTTLSYIRRDNNRCEGLRDRRDASASLSLVSFVTTNLSNLANPLNIRVAGSTNPTLEVQEFSRNYRLDDVQMQPSGNSAIFPLNPTILQKAGITTPTSLLAIAYVIRNTSPVYYPTILGKASGRYTFVLYAPKPTAFKTIQIRKLGTPKPYLTQSLRQLQEGEILLQWNYGNAPAGDYELYVQDSQNKQRHFPFKHNQQWL